MPIDIESEVLRAIGEARFLVGAVKTILQKRTYSGKLHYLPLEEKENSDGTEQVGRAEKKKTQRQNKIVEEDTTSDPDSSQLSKPSTNRRCP